MKARTYFGAVEVNCRHQHQKGERLALLFRQLALPDTGRGAVGRIRIKLKVEQSLFDRDQFQVRLRGGLVIPMKDAPKIGSQVMVAFSVECLGDA